MKLGEVLKRWRLMSDLTLAQASAQMGISLVTLQRIESGWRHVSGRTILKLQKWLFETRGE